MKTEIAMRAGYDTAISMLPAIQSAIADVDRGIFWTAFFGAICGMMEADIGYDTSITILKAASAPAAVKHCCCGEIHLDQERARLIDRILADAPSDIAVQTHDGTWMVPRVYIAWHGLKGREVPALAEKYGWAPSTPS